MKLSLEIEDSQVIIDRLCVPTLETVNFFHYKIFVVCDTAGTK